MVQPCNMFSQTGFWVFVKCNSASGVSSVLSSTQTLSVRGQTSPQRDNWMIGDEVNLVLYDLCASLIVLLFQRGWIIQIRASFRAKRKGSKCNIQHVSLPSPIDWSIHAASSALPTYQRRKPVSAIPGSEPVLSRIQRNYPGEGWHCERVQAGLPWEGGEHVQVFHPERRVQEPGKCESGGTPRLLQDSILQN